MTAPDPAVPAVREVPDLRLVGVAAGTWLASLTALYLSTTSGLVLAGVAAIVGVATATLGRGLSGARRTSAERSRSQSGRRPRTPGRPLVQRLVLGDLRWLVVAILTGVACGAASTAARVSIRDAEPIADLARSHATVTMALTLTGDPHPVGHSGFGPPTYAVDASASEIRTTTLHSAVSVRVFVLAGNPAWAGLLPGQRVVATGRLGPPDGGNLDAALLSVNTAPTPIGRPPWTQRAAGSLRTGLRKACVGLPPRVRGLLPGLIDGDTTRLDPAVSDAFRATGMTHLMAVSGSNVAMIIGAVLLAARWSRRGPVATAIGCAVALVGFVILVRPSPSVLRAAAMGGIGLLALATGRTRAALPALAAVVVGLVVYDPALATDIGFSLSTFATAGLLLIAPSWRDALRRRRVPAGLAEAIAVPAAAQVACSPLIAGISGTVSIVAIPANLLAVPAVPVATIVGVGAAVLSPIWGTGAAFLAWLASWPARWLLFVAERGSTAPAAVAAWPAGTWGALLLAALLAGALIAFRRRTARIVAVVSVIAVVVGAVPVRMTGPRWPPPHALIMACDVGQGDGLVLPVGDGVGVVVDSGPEPAAIDGCLRRLGIRDVALLVFTHFHVDHTGGIDGVIDGRTVGEIVTSPLAEPVEGHRAVVEIAARHHIPVSSPEAGQVYAIGPLRLTVLGPVFRLTNTRSDPNNNSLIMMATENGFRVLLTGDAEVEEQITVLANAGSDALRADVLKMPHHGSSYQDPAFLDAVHPDLVLVSVGAINPYGLPNVPMLDRLTAGGARVLRTDVSGDIAALDPDGRLAVTVRGHPVGQRPP